MRLQIGKRFVRLNLSEEQRYEVARQTIDELRRYGGWKELDEAVGLVCLNNSTCAERKDEDDK